MDELKLKLSTRFMRCLLAKLVSRAIRKKYGYKIEVFINELEIEVNDGEAHVHTSVDAKLSNDELMSILKGIDLD